MNIGYEGKMSNQHLTRNIILALLFGTLAGIFTPQIAPFVKWMGLVFKLSLGMMVMPIIFSSILAGMASITDTKVLGRIGSQTIAYFLLSTFVAISIGMTLVWFIQPGLIPPPTHVAQAVSHLSISSRPNAPEELVSAVKHALGQEFTPEESHILLHILKEHKEASIQELKETTLRLIGPLNLRAQLPESEQTAIMKEQDASLEKLLYSQIEKIFVNPFQALVQKDVLAVILFAMLLGIALHRIGALGQNIFQLNAGFNQALMQMVFWMMQMAPLGVFGLLVDVVSATGPQVFQMLGLYALCVLLGLGINFFILYPIYLILFSDIRPLTFFKAIRPAILVAFSTSSSKATLPVNLQCAEEGLHIKPAISRFVLPLGANMNMNGTALYEAVAAVFIAQLYGISLDLSSQLTIGMMATIAAIGCAGIPAAGTVTMALVLQAVGLPLEGIGLLLAIDRPLDMCRTVVNVVGETVGAAIIQKNNPQIER